MGTPRFLAAVALSVAVAACGSGAKAAVTTTTSTPTTSSAPTTVSSSTSVAPVAPEPTAEATTTNLTTTNPTTSTTGLSGCRSADLAVSLGRSDAGAGHVGTALLFRNNGTGPCVVSGYPGVTGLDASGTQAAQARRTANGYLGGLQSGLTIGPQVTLPPSGVASALVEGTDVPAGTATSCPSYPALLVTPPGATVSVRLTLAAPFPGCSDLLVHPVVPGVTGSN